MKLAILRGSGSNCLILDISYIINLVSSFCTHYCYFKKNRSGGFCSHVSLISAGSWGRRNYSWCCAGAHLLPLVLLGSALQAPLSHEVALLSLLLGTVPVSSLRMETSALPDPVSPVAVRWSGRQAACLSVLWSFQVRGAEISPACLCTLHPLECHSWKQTRPAASSL